MEADDKKILIALEKAENHFGRQSRFSDSSPLDQLIATVLSQRTTYANERKAFESM
jgi:endonuclease-3